MSLIRYSLGFLLMVSPAWAGVVLPFTEDFAASSSNWRRDSSGLQDVGWTATGGPDGSAFVTASFNFVQSVGNDTPILFRAQEEFNSSGNAFVGNWIAGGVDEFSAAVWHDAPVPLTYFVRLAIPTNFPAGNYVFPVPVQPQTWTQISLPLPNAGMIIEGTFMTYEQIFSNIGHVQVGVSAQGVAGLNQEIHFGLDKVSIVPEPATVVLLGAGALVTLRRRFAGRRRS